MSKKVTKKAVTKKHTPTADEKARMKQLNAMKKEQEKQFAKDKKRTETIKEIQKEFTTLCKKYSMKGVMIMDSNKLDTNARIFQSNLTHLDIAGLCQIGYINFKRD